MGFRDKKALFDYCVAWWYVMLARYELVRGIDAYNDPGEEGFRRVGRIT